MIGIGIGLSVGQFVGSVGRPPPPPANALGNIQTNTTTGNVQVDTTTGNVQVEK